MEDAATALGALTRLPREAWHLLPSETVVARLSSDSAVGLESDEAERRRSIFGSNQLPRRDRRSALLRFLSQFHQPLVYLLMGAGVVAAFAEGPVDASVIFGVVVGNAIIGFVQESRAARALEALSKTMHTPASVLRDGRRRVIDGEELVPGDIVLLQSGDKVPADLRLIRSRELRVDESSLTGESEPVEKSAEALPANVPPADRENVVHSTALVTYGAGLGVVTAIGGETEVGRISSLLSSADDLATPLTRKIASFSRILLWCVSLLAIVTFGVGVYRGASVGETLIAAIALAVAAIPEGLPAAVTIVLAIGVARMAKRRAIVRQLPAVETLGSTTVICTDKTGTLTENRMTVRAIYAGGVRYDVSGEGLRPEGMIVRSDESEKDAESAALGECLLAGVLCNDAELRHDDGGWRIEGDPTEGALLVSAAKGGVVRADALAMRPRVDAIPFESQHQYMATLHDHDTPGRRVAWMKGSVEKILDACVDAETLTGEEGTLDRDSVLMQFRAMASRGLRVLALAKREIEPSSAALARDDVRAGMTFLGLQGMIDPPRREAFDAVRRCREAGVRVKMITGDHALTAAAIAESLSLSDARSADGTVETLTGRQIEQLKDDELAASVEKTDVFARVTPEQKLRLVRALQSLGHVAAMTGDGVNDAPALKQADIGIAMGQAGTEVAKEAADIVLADDNFATIVSAVEEGRGVYDNLKKFIAWTLPTDLGEGLVVLVAILLGLPLPILPIHILWINMATAVLLGTMLAFEPKEPGIMRRRPLDPSSAILDSVLAWRIVLVGSMIMLAAFAVFQLSLHGGLSETQARTAAANVFVIVEIFYLFNCRSLTMNVFAIGCFSNSWAWAGVLAMLAAQAAFTYLPFMNALFETAPLGLYEWLLAIAAGFVVFAVIETEKAVRSGVRTLRRHRRTQAIHDRPAH